MFSTLGWKTDDSKEYDSENYVRGVGHADVALKVSGKPVIFIEAKRFGGVPSRLERGVQLTLSGQKIYADWTSEERQVLNYAGMSIDAKWAILTNFEKFRLFNSKTGEVILDIESPAQYLDRIDDLMLLTREQVIDGNINKLEGRIERPDVDLNFLNAMNDWRLKLARNMHKNCPELSAAELQKFTQRILDRFVVIRYAEDRWVLTDPDQLQAAFEYWSKTKTYNSLTDIIKQLFAGFNQIHDSKIFEQDPELDQVLSKVSNDTLSDIIKALYGQNFRKFTSDILGNTYESYLGSQLFINTDNGHNDVELRPTPVLKKSSGVYYTEPPVVHYIVSNAFEKLTAQFNEAVKDYEQERITDSIDKFAKLTRAHVLDPACGSGSFLIHAFENFQSMYRMYNEKINEENQKITNKIFALRTEGRNKEAWELESMRNRPIENFEKKILLENIFGVDIDSSATEIASVNLMLQALKKGEKLPLILQENIKVGNSIIGSEAEELQKFFGENFSAIQPFRWEKGFRAVEGGKFDIVIGNPPYFTISTQHDDLKKYLRENTEWSEVYRGQNDILFYFIMRGLGLLKEGGLLGFIVARYWLESLWADKLRDFILKNAKIKLILDSGNVQFFKGANVLTCIIIFEKDSNCESRSNNNFKVIKVKKWSGSHESLFKHIVAQQGKASFEDEHISIFNSRQGDLGSKPWRLFQPKIDELKEKIQRDSWTLGQEICNIGQGIKTGLNKAFIVTPQVIEKYNLEKEILRKYAKTRDIKRYHAGYRNLYLVYTVPETNPDSIPNTIKYLKQFRKKLEERFQYKAGICTWFGLSIPQNRKLFDGVKEKILVPNYATSNKFAIDNESFYTLTDTYVLAPKTENVSLKFVLGILNSSLMNFYFLSSTKLKRDGYMEYFSGPLNAIPIKKIDFKNEDEKNLYDRIVENVDDLISLSNKRATINLDFNYQIDSPIIEYNKFGNIYRSINSTDYIFADKIGKGTIRKVEVIEENDCLKFDVDLLPVGCDRVEKGYTALKCRIKNEYLRKFILFYANQNWKNLGTGNIFSKILSGKIPVFSKITAENLASIHRIVSSHYKLLKLANDIEHETNVADSRLNRKIYDLYGITEAEQGFVESELENLSNNEDNAEERMSEL